jgi:hypothetical protein
MSMISEAERARRKARQVEAVRRWALTPAADDEERAAWEAIGWDPARWMGSAWCGAWSSGLVDVCATGGPSAKYLKSMASSCDRLCAVGPWGSWGADYEPLNIRGERGRAAAVSREVVPGCIVTVGGDQWGRHVTTVVRVVEGGVLAIGGNQNGYDADGGMVLGGVALTLYPWRDLRRLIRCPDREYAAPAPAVTDEQVEQARAVVDATRNKARGGL